MVNPIVTVNVSTTIAPTPNTLQKKGAFVSQGGTTKAANTTTLLTKLADLTAILTGAAAVTSITRSSTTATATTTAPHGYTTSDVIELTIAGAAQPEYNGNFACTITGASSFTYTVSGTPATPATGTIVWTPEDVAELLAMGTTFFAQGTAQAVYVLELGEGDEDTGVAALATWITANPGVFYAYLVPRLWADESTYLTFVATFEAATAKTYFFTTMTSSNYTTFTAAMKSVVGLVEAPATPATEFSLAAMFYVTLNYDPSTTNKVTPTAFSYLYGVTPYPIPSNGTLLAALAAAGVNYVGTGAEGGVSTSVLFFGTTMDKNDFTYWYSVDWVQINADLDVANAVINGSNNPTNPLYYNQDGINRLEAVLAETMSRGVTFGLVLGNVTQVGLDAAAFTAALNGGTFTNLTVVNAVPFVPYSIANPSDYAIGKYAGLSVSYTPARGFKAITINVNVSQFVAQ